MCCKDVAEDLFKWVETSLLSLEISESQLTYVPRGINKIGKGADLQNKFNHPPPSNPWY